MIRSRRRGRAGLSGPREAVENSLGFSVGVRTKFLEEWWNENRQNLAAQRRHVKARHGSAGENGKSTEVPQGRHRLSRTHFGP